MLRPLVCGGILCFPQLLFLQPVFITLRSWLDELHHGHWETDGVDAVNLRKGKTRAAITSYRQCFRGCIFKAPRRLQASVPVFLCPGPCEPSCVYVGVFSLQLSTLIRHN